MHSIALVEVATVLLRVRMSRLRAGGLRGQRSQLQLRRDSLGDQVVSPASFPSPGSPGSRAMSFPLDFEDALSFGGGC